MEPSDSKPNPVRPAILNHLQDEPVDPAVDQTGALARVHGGEQSRPLGTNVRTEAASVPAPKAALGQSEAPNQSAQPCAVCGYDLRGHVATRFCPECGTLNERVCGGASYQPAEWAPRVDLRDHLARAWYTLGFLSLIPIALLTLLPCLMPFGIVFSVCVGFTPGFRLFALRPFARLPQPLSGAITGQLAWMKCFQWMELGIACAIACYALIATCAWIDAALVPIYFGLVLAWWCVASCGLVAQLRLGGALARECERDVPAKDPSWRNPIDPKRVTLAMRGVAACIGAAAITVALLWIARTTTNTQPRLSDTLGVLGILVWAVTIGCFALVAIFARTHAEMIAVRVLATRALQSATLARATSLGEGADAANEDAPRRIASTPVRPDDDRPIELA